MALTPNAANRTSPPESTIPTAARCLTVLLTLTLGVSTVGPANPTLAAQARATLGTLELPSYREGLPDPNPPFDAFAPPRINYPYTLRTNLTDESAVRAWRAVELENEYLRCTVLPDLGGHLYSCTDKVTGQEMFYANPSIKLTQIGYRGAWAAFGVEFNYPVSHNWMSASSVDFAYRDNEDGSASVWVGNIDRVYGTDWRVELRLPADAAVLEQHTTLYNRSDVRHRYYWWTNAAVEVTDDSWVLYPMEFTASHGFTDLQTWPVDRQGTDNTLVGNHLFGPVSRFSHASREEFMAVYHPDSDTGVMHFSAESHLPSKKIWSWGGDERGIDWRRALSDDSSAYVEIQAGVFRNQETYGYLEPQEVLSFSEYWTPLRALGGLSRATPEAQVHLCRVDTCGDLPSPGLTHVGQGALRVRANVTRRYDAARVEVLAGTRSVLDERVDLDPWTTYDRTLDGTAGADRLTLRISVGSRVLIEHTEGVYAYDSVAADALGSQAVWEPPPPERRSESDVLRLIDDFERNGRRFEAWGEVGQALDRFPGSHELLRVAGRLAVVLGRDQEGVERLTDVIGRVSNDSESLYYLGLAQARLGNASAAGQAFVGALADTRFRASARIQLAALAATAGDASGAVGHLTAALETQPRAPRTVALLSAALRGADRDSDALRLVDQALTRHPSHNFLRYEAVRLGAQDPALWAHFAGDPERVLEVVVEYMKLGAFEEAARLLERDWAPLESVEREPGQLGPREYPLLWYYAAYVRAQRGLDVEGALDRASSLPLRGVFPNRLQSVPVLEWALATRPDDASAQWLLGALRLRSAELTAALAHWEVARELTPTIPSLHRSMGMLLMQQGEVDEAVAVLRDGTRHDALNMGVYAALDAALEASGATPTERADAILEYPDLPAMPAALVYRAVRRLVEAARFDEADALFDNRFFPREEGGINVRQVYLEARLGRAGHAASDGRCSDARQILDRLLEPQPRLEFTNDGLSLWLERAGLAVRVTEIRQQCAPPEALR